LGASSKALDRSTSVQQVEALRTCVEFADAAQKLYPAADVLAVTPTELVVKAPLSCSQETHVVVTRQSAASFCRITTKCLAFILCK
jgi:hypothetical protein